MSKNERLKMLVGVILIVSAIFLYILLHGTRGLLLVGIINSKIKIIPLFDGTKIGSGFINCYLVDALWIFSFNYMLSAFKSAACHILAMLTACALEFLQLVAKGFGTFDFFDILIYLLYLGYIPCLRIKSET